MAILLIVIALLPFALVGLSNIPFLHIEVGGYFPSALYMITSMVIGILFSLVLYPLLNKRIPLGIFFVLSYLFSFFTYFIADILIESVTIPFYVEMIFALFSNKLSNISNINDKKDEENL